MIKKSGLHIILCSSVIITLMIMIGACAHVDAPANQEPEIIICDAADITREECVIAAKVINHGSGTLSYIHFCYGEKDRLDYKSDNLTIKDGEVKYELKNLKPGTTYFYYAEGGTATAHIQSEIRSFTTVPNDRPKISKATPLSSGPVGIIVRFEVEDDGGEKISECGCEVKDLSTSETRRIYVSADDIEKSIHNLTITGLTPNVSYSITSFASNSTGESLAEPLDFTTRNGIVLHQAGVLKSLFGNEDINETSLSIAGELNGTDIRFLREIVGGVSDSDIKSSVTDLDLTDANIIAGGESFDGSRYTEKDIISTGMFKGCPNLHNIILPNSVTSIKREAFEECGELKELVIPLHVKELYPSSGCKKLQEIKVSDANDSYSSFDGVLFNRTQTEIIWFPLGKTGHFALPNTITAIGENAFSGTAITSLEIPASVVTIKRGAFSGSALQEITLPDNLANISEGMFQNCTSLKTLRLGKETGFIGNYAFDGAPLSSIYLSATVPPYVSAEAFTNKTYSLFSNCVLYVPAASRNIYRNHSKWNQFENIVGL